MTIRRYQAAESRRPLLSEGRVGSFASFLHLLLFAALLLVVPRPSCAQNAAYSNRVVPGILLPSTTPTPVIDGDISDAAWKIGAHVTTFIDSQTSKPAPDQTDAYLLYDRKYIYLAFHCHDSQPAQIAARETVQNADLEQDERVMFRIDPFLTHNGADASEFEVNAIGTQRAQLAGGRAAKLEWQGLWTAAVKRVMDGWTAEMRIPWAILSYPQSHGPITMGVQIARNQSRTHIWSWFSDLGSRGLELEGRWTGVQPPATAWKPRLSLLPYTLTGGNLAAHKTTARGGLDLRYQPTPDLTGVGAIHPDFSTVEGAVAGIGFSRSERFVPERRPFFLDGGDFFDFGRFYQLGSLFNSGRIKDLDVGSKIYGQLSPAVTVGALGTYREGGNGNIVTSIRRNLSPSSGINSMVIHHQAPGEENTIIGIEPTFRKEKWSVDGQLDQTAGMGAGGMGTSAALNFEQVGFFTSWQWRSAAPNFLDRLGFIPFVDFKGFQSYSNWETNWRRGPFRGFDLFFSPTVDWHMDGRPFRRQGSVGGYLETRSDYRIGGGIDGGSFAQTDGGVYKKQMDLTFSVSLEGGVSNRFRHWNLNYQTGKQADKPYTSWGPGFSVRLLRKLDLLLSSFVQSYQGISQQHILTMNYEMDPTRSWGGRAVVQNGDVNWYLAFRNAGHTGTETYFIVGDPNSKRFVKQALIKLVFSL